MSKLLLARVSKSSFLWGGLASFAFYTMIHNHWITNVDILRYTAMHPVEYAITTMFFVGIAGLVIKYFDVRHQWSRLKMGAVLEKFGSSKIGACEASRLLEQVRANEKQYGISLYTNRLYTLLTKIRHAGSAEKLDEEFRCLADEDYNRCESDYGLTKMIIWAIPILGFLGTVIGIALAMGNLAPEALEESLPKVMGGLTIAFDTTALALALSMVVYFSQFLIWKDEQKLLNEVSQRAEFELSGRFETIGVQGDSGQLSSVRMMIEAVLEAIEQLVVHQSEIWDQAMNAANSRFMLLASESSSQLKSTLTIAMRESAEAHARVLVKAEQQLLAETRENVKQIAGSIHGNVESMVTLQASVTRQAEVLQEVVHATGQVTKLEDRLNQNLSALAGARHFEETVNSLGAVIHLLNTKLSSLPGASPAIQLPGSKGKGHAA